MNVLWTRFLRATYRKEPISSFILIAGSVDAVIGGVDQSWSLLSFGIATVGVAIALRWWQTQPRELEVTEKQHKYFLTSSSSSTALPVLNENKRQSPR